MFSIKEKQMISQKIEELLLSLDHPEMSKEKPMFELHINGKEKWSWAHIVPKWTFEDTQPVGKVWNEVSRDVMEDKNESI